MKTVSCIASIDTPYLEQEENEIIIQVPDDFTTAEILSRIYDYAEAWREDLFPISLDEESLDVEE